MNKYKIIKRTYPNGRYDYEVKKRLFGFLWWYNWLNIDAETTGFFNKFDDAYEAIREDRKSILKEVVYKEW